MSNSLTELEDVMLSTLSEVQQEGSLCAVHCLNALLQSSYFSAVELAELASNMDKAEQQRMAELGTNTQEYQQFMSRRGEGSNNMDDSGMFSIQVVSSALEVFGLALTPFTSTVAPTAEKARDDPTTGVAYICNMKEHWFTVRKLGFQWFNLNSLLARPELLSDTYLSLFLAQLQTQGYNIYIVEGALPQCTADEVLKLSPVTQTTRPPLLSELSDEKSSSRNTFGSEEDQLRAAVAASLSDGTEPVVDTDSDDELEKAMQMSLTEHLASVAKESAAPNLEDLREKRLKALEKREN